MNTLFLLNEYDNKYFSASHIQFLQDIEIVEYISTLYLLQHC